MHSPHLSGEYGQWMSYGERAISDTRLLAVLRPYSRHHCQQLGNLLCVAGGVGSNATAEAVDGRAEAVQLSVVDSRIVDVGWLCRNHSCIRPEGWLARGCVAVDSVHIGVEKWLNRRRSSESGRSPSDKK